MALAIGNVRPSRHPIPAVGMHPNGGCYPNGGCWALCPLAGSLPQQGHIITFTFLFPVPSPLCGERMCAHSPPPPPPANPSRMFVEWTLALEPINLLDEQRHWGRSQKQGKTEGKGGGGGGQKWGYGLGGLPIRCLKEVSLWQKKMGPSTQDRNSKHKTKKSLTRVHSVSIPLCGTTQGDESDWCCSKSCGLGHFKSLKQVAAYLTPHKSMITHWQTKSVLRRLERKPQPDGVTAQVLLFGQCKRNPFRGIQGHISLNNDVDWETKKGQRTPSVEGLPQTVIQLKKTHPHCIFCGGRLIAGRLILHCPGPTRRKVKKEPDCGV